MKIPTKIKYPRVIMKLKFAIPAVLLAVASPSALALGPGDIAFTGFNADSNDDFAFVALESIPADSVIFFTDNEWNGSDVGSGGAFNTGEMELMWTSPDGGVAAGSIVVFNDVATATPTANIGTVVLTISTETGLANASEIIHAFIGTSQTPTAFLAAITNAAASNANYVITGTGLTYGSTAVQLTSSTNGARYKGARSGEATFGDYRTLIGNIASNWDEDALDGTIYLPFSTNSFTTGGPAPETLTVTLNPTSISENGGTSTATIARTGTAAVTINLTSSDTTEATVLATVDIPENVASVDVTVTAQNDTIYDSSQNVFITASQTDHIDGIASLTVTDDFLDLSALTVNEIYHTPQSDANGDTVTDADDEFVELVNTSGGNLDISNWTVSDVTAIRHTFAADTVLAPNQAILVFSALPSSPDLIGGSIAVASTTGNLSLGATDSVVIRNDSAVEIHRINYTSTTTSPAQSLNLASEPNPSAYVNHNDLAGIATDLSPGTRADGTPWLIPYSLWASQNGIPGALSSDDSDNDGVENGIEYFMGESGSSFTVMPGLDGTNTITWPVNVTYSGTYEVQTSTDLVTWTNVDPKPSPRVAP